jgi:hypothetical protein
MPGVARLRPVPRTRSDRSVSRTIRRARRSACDARPRRACPRGPLRESTWSGGRHNISCLRIYPATPFFWDYLAPVATKPAVATCRISVMELGSVGRHQTRRRAERRAIRSASSMILSDGPLRTRTSAGEVRQSRGFPRVIIHFPQVLAGTGLENDLRGGPIDTMYTLSVCSRYERSCHPAGPSRPSAEPRL